MATVTHRATVNVTTNSGAYNATSFTPTAGDLVVVVASGSAALSTDATVVGSNNNLNYLRIGSPATRASVDNVHLFVADTLVPAGPAAMIMTFSPGVAATGAVFFVFTIAGMTKAGLQAVRNYAANNGAAASTPGCVFGSTTLTGNVILASVFNATNPATMTAPASFTENADVGYATPTQGGEYATRNSGHTSTTVTYGGTSASAWAGVFAEFDTDTAVTEARQSTDVVQIIMSLDVSVIEARQSTEVAQVIVAVKRGKVTDLNGNPLSIIDTGGVTREIYSLT